ncbi:MAG: type I restriction enzyme HsdR N-terminal domain-containing protein [Candidatus Marsarchaeota archaeon]|nr:type I restriction enzyme HsdR N-terminal domain-containing protein [Candidatus Marsarchaeota archaeon]MCL5418962.1 type I restriction enzyme HsdR N-terminal domain-containing protein [Candidatus Marsarchaeota archaeon]
MEDKQVWQVAAGTQNRDYTNLFYKWGIATVGPGVEGEWDENRYNNSDKVGKRDKSLLKQFVKDVKPGDYIILKVGKNAKAIGVIEKYEESKAYFWNENFRYIDGWQLGHCLKVKWREPKNKKKLKLRKTLTEQRFCRYSGDDGEIEKKFKSLKPVKSKSLEDIKMLGIPKGLKDENYEEHLKPIFNDINKLKKFWKEISGLQKYAIDHYDTSNYSEEEAKIFFIVPILKALGWSNEHIAIEHEKVDILLSYKDFTTRDFDNEKEKNKVDVIIESKRMDEGLGDAKNQANNYLKKFKKDEIKYIVSNGLVSYIYKKNEDKKIACLDIENLWIEHLPYDNEVKGAKEFLNLMLYHE